MKVWIEKPVSERPEKEGSYILIGKDNQTAKVWFGESQFDLAPFARKILTHYLVPVNADQDELWNGVVARVATANLMGSVTPGDVEATNKWKSKAIEELSKYYHLIKKNP